MAQEKLPNKDVGTALDTYHKERGRVVGNDLTKSGLKALGVGLFATAAILATVVGITITTSVGVLLAGGALGYGGVKVIEGVGKRWKAK